MPGAIMGPESKIYSQIPGRIQTPLRVAKAVFRKFDNDRDALH
jgi:hypothetical protein